MPSAAPQVHRLVYRPPVVGKAFWILDGALPDPLAVRARLLQRDDWMHGAPVRPESWPGQRAQPALAPEEMAPIEAWVRQQTCVKKLFSVQPDVGSDRFNHNCVQLVGAADGSARPHTDSRRLCRYAGVLYLNPDVPDHCGTTLYRVRLPDGTLGGNTVPSRYANLVEALDTRFVNPGLFVPDIAFDHRFNRLVVYRADMIHSASAYWGDTLLGKRMTVVFFWMA